ncbi:hypothetical protein AVEN_238322-1 [Araneus ventricosus]|uniref:Uncharacterized protein n=1 Tax=Araneus ventricosus TaxID=182803 RepID=A0A4Y2GHZ4_ARAVE|nr:hypothetical protein AVEN_238322-1 [Araneus ventricosus]
MGELSKDRVTPNRPFSVCGIDYAGPISVLKHRGRRPKTMKGYIVIFVCFATKALHLELVASLMRPLLLLKTLLLRLFCEAPRNFELWSNDENASELVPPSPKFRTTPAGGCLVPYVGFSGRQAQYTTDLQWNLVLNLELSFFEAYTLLFGHSGLRRLFEKARKAHLKPVVN